MSDFKGILLKPDGQPVTLHSVHVVQSSIDGTISATMSRELAAQLVDEGEASYVSSEYVGWQERMYTLVPHSALQRKYRMVLDGRPRIFGTRYDLMQAIDEYYMCYCELLGHVPWCVDYSSFVKGVAPFLDGEG